VVDFMVKLSAIVKELLKSDSICQSYAQMKRVQFFLTHSVFIINWTSVVLQVTSVNLVDEDAVSWLTNYGK